jgi:hypothetical protein
VALSRDDDDERGLVVASDQHMEHVRYASIPWVEQRLQEGL